MGDFAFTPQLRLSHKDVRQIGASAELRKDIRRLRCNLGRLFPERFCLISSVNMRLALEILNALVVLFILLFNAANGLSESEQAMHAQALLRYYSAHVDLYYHHNWEPDPQYKWRQGFLKSHWLQRAKVGESALYIGQTQPPFHRKTTYFYQTRRQRSRLETYGSTTTFAV